MSKVTCPSLLIHGQKDSLIPFSHSIELSKATSGPYELILPEDMDHNDFNIYEDFLDPISEFLNRNSLINSNSWKLKVEIPSIYFEIPEYITDPENMAKKDMMSKMLRKLLKI